MKKTNKKTSRSQPGFLSSMAATHVVRAGYFLFGNQLYKVKPKRPPEQRKPCLVSAVTLRPLPNSFGETEGWVSWLAATGREHPRSQVTSFPGTSRFLVQSQGPVTQPHLGWAGSASLKSQWENTVTHARLKPQGVAWLWLLFSLPPPWTLLEASTVNDFFFNRKEWEL